MRKRILGPAPPRGDKPDGREWLNLRELAEVEVTSEGDGYRVESAFSFGIGPGWRAATPGKQRIRLLFDRPQLVQRMRLRFDEANIARTQEFTVRSSWGAGEPSRELIRQQWNFSPDGSTVESEEYVVNLKGVTILELTIDPDCSRGDAIASLTDWRLG